MPVTPPYSVIGDVARLRAQGTENLATGILSAGQSVGAGIQRGFQGQALQKQADAKALAGRYHEATLFADKNFDWQHVAPPPAPGAAPSAAGAGGGGSDVSPILGAANGPTPPPPPPPPPPKRPEGAVTMNDLYTAHGLKPVAGGDQIFGTPKAQAKSEAAQILEALKTSGRLDVEKEKGAQAEKTAKEKEAAKFDATHMDVDDKMGKVLGLPAGTYPTDFIKTKMSVEGRDRTSKTAADAKKAAAEISASAKKDVANINAKLKSPDNQIRLQAMKDRDAYIVKNPTTAKLFGVPGEIGAEPAKAAGTSDAGAHPFDAEIDQYLAPAPTGGK